MFTEEICFCPTFDQCYTSVLCIHTLLLCYSLSLQVIHMLKLQQVTISCVVLSSPVLSCPVPSCLVLSCPVSDCPVLFCPVLSRLVLSLAWTMPIVNKESLWSVFCWVWPSDFERTHTEEMPYVWRTLFARVSGRPLFDLYLRAGLRASGRPVNEHSAKIYL